MERKKSIRALCLLSGGLDSLLAICVLKQQGISVTGLTFTSPFFGSKNAEIGAQQVDVPLTIVDITEEHLPLVKHPPHGYGKQMNPCIDCHALMVRRAGDIMRREHFDFIATGEVLGERPMSQNRQSLDIVAKASGCADDLLRPLSAQLLPPTRPEREGLVDRDRLYAIEGRSRKPQMALAQQCGITSYVQPAGGCLLTDPAYAARLRELLEHDPDAEADDMRLLRMGRHFRLPSGAKAIVGRDEKDNGMIEAVVQPGDVLFVTDPLPGPVVLLRRSMGPDDIELSARLCASYADHDGADVDIECIRADKRERIAARPMPRNAFAEIKIS